MSDNQSNQNGTSNAPVTNGTQPANNPAGQNGGTQQRRPVRRSSGLPNPNQPVQNPRKAQSQQSVPLQQRPANPAPVDEVQQQVQPQQEVKPKKSKKKVVAIAVAAILIVAVAAGVIIKQKNANKPEPTYQVSVNYEETGRYPLDNYLAVIADYNSDAIKELVPNSWVAQEWKYANSEQLRESWIKSICSYVSIEYPESQVKDNIGNLMVNADGSAMMELSPVLNGETITLTVVDYKALAATMNEDIQLITDQYLASGYSPSDYEYQDEMTNLMLDYLLSKANFPTKQVSVKVQIGEGTGVSPEDTTQAIEDSGESVVTNASPMAFTGSDVLIATPLAENADTLITDMDGLGSDSQNADIQTPTGGTVTEDSDLVIYISAYDEIITAPDGSTSSVVRYKISDDSALDQLLFSSDDFHFMLDTYGGLIANIEYSKEDEEIQAQKAEYDKKVKDSEDKLKKLQDEAKKRAEEEGLSDKEVKEAVSKVKLPEKDVVPEWVEPERMFSSEYTPESVITYTWLGAYYAQNIYEGESNKEAQVGDGTFELPAGIGTTIVTKAFCADGKFHDVKVTLLTYKIGQDAIDYAVKYSEKNRGFDASSQVKLICYEVKVENLEDQPITVTSDMFLSDAQSNKSARTGDMYGFYSEAEIAPHESTVFNDWATSTEMEQKYVCWGKSFERQYPVVWFKLLAGSGGEVPKYNAQESYVNQQSNVEEDSEVDISEETEVVDTQTSVN